MGSCTPWLLVYGSFCTGWRLHLGSDPRLHLGDCVANLELGEPRVTIQSVGNQHNAVVCVQIQVLRVFRRSAA
jgi:hypothetical protein